MRFILFILMFFCYIAKGQIIADTIVYIANSGDTIKSVTYRNASTTTTATPTRLRDTATVLRGLIDLKQNILGFTPYNATNPNGYISAVPAQTFASLTGKPTTLSGYGITDAAALSHTHAYNTLTGLPTLFTQSNADALYSVLAHVHTFSSLTSKPTTISGYGITDAYPLSGNPSSFLVAGDIAGKANLASPTFTGTVVLPNSTVTNGMLAGSIAYSKLLLTGAILNADLAGSIDLTTKVTGVLPFANGGIGSGAATSATSGTMTVAMTTEMITITPTNACTFNASGGVTGQRVTFVITTSGVSSFTLTWNTNFRTTGTLATGTTTAKIFCVTFIYNGSVWLETNRTAAM